MLYSVLGLVVYVLVSDVEFIFNVLISYWVLFFYLVVFGIVIVFVCYFVLFKNIGFECVSYVIVLFLLVVVVLSILFEGFEW